MTRIFLGIFLAAFAPQLACAHASLETTTAKSGAQYKAVVRIGHGCEGTATTTLRVTIPEGLIGVHPMPKAGWKLEIVSGPYAKTYEIFGKPVAEGAQQIVWSGGSLPDAFYDEFVFTGTIAKGVRGQLAFPVIQECEKGRHDWVDLPKDGGTAHDPKASPAPLVFVGEERQAATFTAGPLTITALWTRATPKGAEVAGGYLTVTNTGKDTDRLLGGSVSIATRFEIHEMTSADGVMKMRHLDKGLEIKAGETVGLKPGGLHIMLMGLSAPIKEGDRITGTLVFEKAGTVAVEFVAGGMGGGAPTAKGAGEHVH